MAVEAKLSPCGSQSGRSVGQIKKGDVLGITAITGLANGRTPDAGILKAGAERGRVDGVAVAWRTDR